MPPISTETMGAFGALAMWGDANIMLTQQHIILQHLQQFFGHQIMVPEANIYELGVRVVNPKTVTIQHNQKNLTYSYREIDKLIGRFITDQFRKRNDF
jgi:hypothetical protein